MDIFHSAKLNYLTSLLKDKEIVDKNGNAIIPSNIESPTFISLHNEFSREYMTDLSDDLYNHNLDIEDESIDEDKSNSAFERANDYYLIWSILSDRRYKTFKDCILQLNELIEPNSDDNDTNYDSDETEKYDSPSFNTIN